MKAYCTEVAWSHPTLIVSRTAARDLPGENAVETVRRNWRVDDAKKSLFVS
jgi:hypothetical protein